ncbi:hypothetical protein [Salinivibrio sp. SS2]|nr:hypothetical protein [Salinivibrio sp. DV]
MEKQYDELVMQKLINEANAYLDKFEALLTSVERRLVVDSKAA